MKNGCLAVVLATAFAVQAGTSLDCVDPFIGTEGTGSQYGGMQPYVTVPFGSIHVVPKTRENRIGRLSFNSADTNLVGIILTRQPAIWMGDWGWTEVRLPQPCPIESIVSHPEKTVVRAGGRTIEWTATEHATWIRGDLEGVELADGVNRRRHDEHLGYRLENFGGWHVVDRPDVRNLRIGVSLISSEQARRNLAAEIPAGTAFESVVAATRGKWEAAFSRLEIDAPDDVKTIFYTGLFHALLYPRKLDEEGRYYSAFDDRVHALKPGMTGYYNCFSLWDTYRAEHPLLTLIQPERVPDMMNSLLTMYEEGGWLPKWPNPGYTGIMIGSPAEVVLAEACTKGFPGIDWNLAYAAAKKNATVPQTNDRTFAWEDRGCFGRTPETRGGLTRYLELGYVAGDETAESVSRTQDFCLDDLATAILAEKTGHADEAAVFRRRAKNYTNLWNAAVGEFRPRAANGAFMEAKDGPRVNGRVRVAYCEQAPHTAVWALPFDTDGLAALLGGKKPATQKLDRYFETVFWQPERGNKSIHGNETSHHCAYLYNRFGHPEKTQQRVREILTRAYSTNRKGFDGNEDCGQMSAWYILSALGFYPLDPATGEYELGSPLVRGARLRVGTAELEIRVTNYAPDRWRVRQARLNGRELRDWRVRHADLVRGGVLEFVMEDGKAPVEPLAAFPDGDSCHPRHSNGAGYPQSVDDINVRDPFVTVDRGEGVYRLYSAKPWSGGDAVFVRKSKDLKNWTEPVKVMAVDPAWKVTAVWAPEVHEYAGKWYLLVTLTQNTGKNLMPSPASRYPHALLPRGTWIFVSDGRDGPFRPVKEGPVTPPEWSCLDGTLWVEKGEPYLVFCHEWCQTGEGRMMCAKLKSDLSGFAGEPVELFRAGVQAKGGFKVNAENPALDAVTDGPFLFRSVQSGVLTMTWSGCPSGGAYPTFRCESETGSVLGPWKRHGVLTRDGGHSMLFHDLSGRLFLCSHAPNGSPKERMRLTRLDESGYSLRVVDPLRDRPDRFDRIQVNQLGYLPAATKRCFVEAPPKLEFRVQRLDEETGKRVWHDVFAGRFVKVPRTSATYEGDFSAVTRPGDYRIVCGAATEPAAYGPGPEYKGILSCAFDIREGVYDSAVRAMLGYYTWQRCGSRKGWAGVCHQEKCPLLDADGKTVGEVDARGGYHQSCDLRNWTDGISLSLFNLLRFAEFGAPRWDDGELEEELRWGIDHFLRISPKGFVYDSEFVPIGWGPVHYYARPAPYGAQANTVMLFARAARFFAKRDAAYAAQLTDRARAIFHDMETNPFFDKAQPSGELPLPGGTQPWETWYQYNYRTTALGFSQRGSAALELYRTTHDDAFLALARKYAAEAAGRRIENGKDMLDVNCGYSRFLSSYRLFLELAREVGDEDCRRICLEKAEAVRQLSRDNLGPTAVFQGTASISLVTHAAYLLEVGKVLGRDDFRADAQRMVDWVLGANPQLQSLVEGIGYNQERRPVFGQFYPSTPQIPGAVLHRMRGEYDMPPVSWLLLALRLLT